MAIDVKNLACAQMGLVGMSEYNMMQFQITGFFFFNQSIILLQHNRPHVTTD